MGAKRGEPHASPRTGHVDRLVDRRNGYVVYRGRVTIRGKPYVVKVGVPKPDESDGHRRGRQRSERSYEEECWRRLRQKIREVQAGTLIDRSKDRLFSTQAEAWLAEQEHTLRDRSLENYRSIVAGHLIPALGQLMLSEITREAVTRMLAEKARPRTVWLKDGPIAASPASRRRGWG